MVSEDDPRFLRKLMGKLAVRQQRAADRARGSLRLEVTLRVGEDIAAFERLRAELGTGVTAAEALRAAIRRAGGSDAE